MLRIGGRKSRNKVIVGEPAIGSLIYENISNFIGLYLLFFLMTTMVDSSVYHAMKDEL